MMGILILCIWWYIGYISICIIDKIISKINQSRTGDFDETIVISAFGGLMIPFTAIIIGVIYFFIWLPRKLLRFDK